MFDIKVLGSGCKKCEKVAEKLSSYAAIHNINASVTKETNPEAFVHYAIMKTPAVVINEQLVHSGSIPTDNDIESWLK